MNWFKRKPVTPDLQPNAEYIIPTRIYRGEDVYVLSEDRDDIGNTVWSYTHIEEVARKIVEVEHMQDAMVSAAERILAGESDD